MQLQARKCNTSNGHHYHYLWTFPADLQIPAQAYDISVSWIIMRPITHASVKEQFKTLAAIH